MASPGRGTVSPSSPSMAARPQLYQIDFTAVASGKRIASTKRRVRWRFGFANPEALANGETGTACRGEEHDVTIVWSITSGKRLILADGQEVHYSNSRNNLFEFSWTMKGNHVLKVVAHASPPIQANPGFRQYDFFVDGQSFFSFPKVYRLGLAANDPRGAGPPHASHGYAERGQPHNGTSSYRSQNSGTIAAIEAPHNPDEEEAYLREAIKNSLKEQYHHPSGASVQSAPPATGGDLLLDFGDPVPAPGPGAMTPYVQQPSQDIFGAPTPQPSYATLPPAFAPQQAPQSADPWGAPAALPAPSPMYGAPAPVPAIAYGAPGSAPGGYDTPVQVPVQQSNPYGGPPTDPYGAPTPQSAPPLAPNPFGAPVPQQPPPPQQQQPIQFMYGQSPAQPPPVPYQQQPQQPNPFGSPAPTTVSASQDYTPASSIGFASPMAFNAPQPVPASEPETVQPEPAQTSTDPALFSMGVLSNQASTLGPSEPTSNGNGTATGGSLADQAYSKFINMDPFDLVKDKAEQKNPFEFSGSIANNAPLSEMKKGNSNQPKKPIMNASPGAMVLSNNQQGNFGGYGMQAGMGQQQQYQQPPMAQPMSGYAQSPMQPSYGQAPMQQQQPYGQQPQYGQQQYGTPQQFGQQPPMQQQYMQQQYGQPPMQQPWGGM